MSFKPTFLKFTFFTLLLLLGGITYSQTVDFTFSTPSGNYCSPTQVQFVSTAPGTPTSYLWSFGNGTTSNIANPTAFYNVSGVYTVTLQVVYQQSAVVVEKTIPINAAAIVSLNQDKDYICKPGNITFSASGNIGAGSYYWSFGDGTDTTTNTSTITHFYAAMGNYTINLTASTPAGCTATSTSQVRVAPPTITASLTPSEGCIPIIVSFNASAEVPVGGSVANYEWNYGDSYSSVTTSNNSSHAYTITGSFNPSLKITTNDGCTNTFNYNSIAFGRPPINIRATSRKDTFCASDTMVFYGKADSATDYRWDFGDGESVRVGRTDTIVRHQYRSLGTKYITLTPFYNGCQGLSKQFPVTVIGVISNYSSANTCIEKQTFSFENNSTGNLSYTRWNCGDGTIRLNVDSFRHTYMDTGTFKSSLIIYDSVSRCADTTYKNLFYYNPALIGSDTLVCKGTRVNFSLINNYRNPAATYFWSVAGDSFGPISQSTLNNFMTGNHGLHYNQVIINNGPGYCPDTIKQVLPIRVRGPKMAFTMINDVCVTSSLQVTNSSYSFYPEDGIAYWYWNFGNKPSNDTIYQPLPYQYEYPATYNVTAYAVDLNNCRDSLTKQAYMRPIPYLILQPKFDTICYGQNKLLYAYHTDGNLNWTSTATIGCPSCDTILVSPTTSTYFKATVVNQFGCTNTDSIHLKVYVPFSATSSLTNAAICLKDSIQLNVYPTDKMVKWLPAAGLSSSSILNPIASPPQTGKYIAALMDSAGCFYDTATINITVKSLPQVDAGPNRLYPFFSNFIFQPTYSSNVERYTWTPATSLNCSTCAVPTGRNDKSQMYTVTVVSDSGCIAKDSVQIMVECKDAYLLMPTAFSPDKNGLNDIYYPLTRGIKSIKSFIIYNRSGQILFQRKNFPPNEKSFGWDGHFNGSLQAAGAYVFMMEAECDAGQTLNHRGSFVLIN